MSLKKAIKHGKEKREEYRGVKAVDPTCRNHGGDEWAESNRLISSRRKEESAEAKLKDANTEDLDQ